MKKTMLTMFSAITTIMLGAIAGPVASAGQIRVATQPIPAFAPLFVAQKKGWVNQELAKAGGASDVVTFTSFPAGPPIIESFAAGQQDIGLLGDNPAIIGKAAGLNTRIIALTSSGPKGLAVVVPSRSAITSPRQLKGKRIGVVKGSYAHHLLLLVLRKGGLSVNDIELINLSQADIASAIANGNIDAAAIWDPLITRLRTQHVVRVLTDGTGLKKGILVIIASNDFLTRNRDKTKALLKAYQRGSEFIRANPEAAAKLISTDVNLAPDLLLPVLKKFDYNPVIHVDDLQEIRNSETFLIGNGLIKSPVNIDQFVDLQVSREALLRK